MIHLETVEDLIDSFQYREGIALVSYLKSKEVQDKSYSELYEEITSLAKGFLELNLKHGDYVPLLFKTHATSTRLALSLAGLVPAMRGVDVTSSDLETIFELTRPSLILVEDGGKIFDKVKQHAPPSLEEIITLSPILKSKSLQDVQDLGKKSSLKLPSLYPSDICEGFFTVDDDGDLLAPLLSNRSRLGNINTLLETYLKDEEVTLLTHLPEWHIFGNTMVNVFLAGGGKIVYVPTQINNQKKFLKVIQEEKPTHLACVPLVLKKFVDFGLQRAKIEKGFFYDRFINALVDHEKGDFSLLYSLIPESKIEKLRESKKNYLGERLEYILVGGAFLEPYVEKTLIAMGLKVIKGYGLTQAGIVATRLHGKQDYPSVGHPLEEIKILDYHSGNPVEEGKKGEIWVNGSSNMVKLLGNPEKTKWMMTPDGWLRTEDEGYIKDGQLFITAYYKDLLIPATGENIVPQPLEQAIEGEYIKKAIVVGTGREFHSVLINPNMKELRNYFRKHENIVLPEKLSDDYLYKTDEGKIVLSFFNEILNERVSEKTGFHHHEKIRYFSLIADPLSVRKGSTMSWPAWRAEIEQKYKDAIDLMYARGMRPWKAS